MKPTPICSRFSSRSAPRAARGSPTSSRASTRSASGSTRRPSSAASQSNPAARSVGPRSPARSSPRATSATSAKPSIVISAQGRPAFAPRVGPSPKDVVRQIRAAGGLASLAHPAKFDDDDLVRDIVRDGIDAIEVYHPDHDDGAMTRYHQCAAANNLLVTGGSDYHGPGSGRTAALGHVGLSGVEFARLAARAARGPRV